jgi:hypothetical protein
VYRYYGYNLSGIWQMVPEFLFLLRMTVLQGCDARHSGTSLPDIPEDIYLHIHHRENLKKLSFLCPPRILLKFRFRIHHLNGSSTFLQGMRVWILNKKIPWSESASELYRPSDRRLSAKWLPTFADRGCHVVKVTDPYGRILGFLDRNHYFSIK